MAKSEVEHNMLKRREIKGLLLYVDQSRTSRLSYNDDWVDAIIKYSPVSFDAWNLADRKSRFSIIPKLRKYELIILLHSTNSNSASINPILAKALLYRKGKLVIFVGNEYKLMPDKMKLIQKMDADYVVSQCPLDVAEWMYTGTDAKVISLPHALNPDVYKPVVSHRKREIDIGGRYYGYPWYLGDCDREAIHEFFLAHMNKLKLNISSDPKDRFQRDGWVNFLNRCKGTISTEAGTSFLERDDHTRNLVNAFMKKTPEVTFEEIQKRFFSHHNSVVSGKVVSSRHFDAIGTKTCQIMFPGRYNDILKPDEHYIALNRDFSNIVDVLKRFQDDEYRMNMVDNVREYVMDSHTHRHRIEKLFNAIEL